jgi:hypothetical protein
MRKIILLVGFVLLVGCQQSPNEVTRLQTFGDSEVIVTSANQRLVTERPSADGRSKIFCTEPSPDVAVAFQKAAAFAASGSAPQGGSGSLSGSTSSNEAITQLAGRTAGVLALRDGLYYICQGYANGTFNKTDFAISLSQYGRLLVALVGGASPAANSPGQGASPGGSQPALPGGGMVLNISNGGAAPQAQQAAQNAKAAPPPAANPPPADIPDQDNILLIACLSAYGDPGSTPISMGNGVLSPALCARLLQNLVTRSDIPPATTAPRKKTPNKPTPVAAAGQVPAPIERPVGKSGAAAPEAAPGAPMPLAPTPK